MTTIRYFLPEDGDKEEHPNVFLTPRKRQTNQAPLLADVKEAFPLPGKYHFRFKCPLIPGGDMLAKHQLAVWMDCVSDTEPIPSWRNGFVAKVTRISMEEDEEEEEEEDSDEEFEMMRENGGRFQDEVEIPSHSPITPVSPVPPKQEKLFNVFDEVPSVAGSISSHAGSISSQGNLFDARPIDKVESLGSGASLLDMTAPPSRTENHDFFGGTAPAPPPSGDLLGMASHRPVPTHPKVVHPPPQQQQPAYNTNSFQGYPQQQQQQNYNAPHQNYGQQGYGNGNATPPNSFGNINWNAQGQGNQQQGQANQQHWR